MEQNTGRVLEMTPKRHRRSKPVDPTEVPLYSVNLSAYIIGVPPSTLNHWFYGRSYSVNGRTFRSPRVITPADARNGLLSFANLGEAHMLEAIRKRRFSLRKVREALELLQQFGPHPLISATFYKRGKKLLASTLTSGSDVMSVSSPNQGQKFLEDLDLYFERIALDDSGKLVRLFPMRKNPNRTIVSDLYISSGEPVIAGTGILAQFVYERNVHGESAQEIAADYGIDEQAVADAIGYASSAA